MNNRTIQQITDELNNSGGRWTVVDGVQALTQVAKNNETYTFNPASGVLVKIFMNEETGELKLFPARFISDSF